MPVLYVSKGVYQVSAQDILDTLAGASTGTGDLHISGNYFWKSGTAFEAQLDHANTAPQIYTFPNASGTIPLLQTGNTWLSNNTFQAITHFRVALTNIANVIDITANGVLTNGRFTAFTIGNTASNNNAFQISYVHNSSSGGRYLSIGPFESGVGAGCMNFVANNLVQFIVSTTGAGSAALGANCPAITPGAPYTWIKMISPDGNIVFFPVWK